MNIVKVTIPCAATVFKLYKPVYPNSIGSFMNDSLSICIDYLKSKGYEVVSFIDNKRTLKVGIGPLVCDKLNNKNADKLLQYALNNLISAAERSAVDKYKFHVETNNEGLTITMVMYE